MSRESRLTMAAVHAQKLSACSVNAWYECLELYNDAHESACRPITRNPSSKQWRISTELV